MTLPAALLVGTENFGESWVEAPCKAEQLARESKLYVLLTSDLMTAIR